MPCLWSNLVHVPRLFLLPLLPLLPLLALATYPMQPTAPQGQACELVKGNSAALVADMDAFCLISQLFFISPHKNACGFTFLALLQCSSSLKCGSSPPFPSLSFLDLVAHWTSLQAYGVVDCYSPAVNQAASMAAYNSCINCALSIPFTGAGNLAENAQFCNNCWLPFHTTTANCPGCWQQGVGGHACQKCLLDINGPSVCCGSC